MPRKIYFQSPREEYILKHPCRHMSQSCVCPTFNSGIVITGSCRKKYSITVWQQFYIIYFNSKTFLKIDSALYGKFTIHHFYTCNTCIYLFSKFSLKKKHPTRTNIFQYNNLTLNKTF